jgi:hypothetical protein
MRYLKSYKIFESSDESEQWLKDIFLELEDEGYNINIKNSKGNFHSSAAMCSTYDVTISREKSFKLPDIFEIILTAESYMKDDGWYVNRVRFRSIHNKWFSLDKRDINKLRDINILRKEIHEITYIEIEFKPGIGMDYNFIPIF